MTEREKERKAIFISKQKNRIVIFFSFMMSVALFKEILQIVDEVIFIYFFFIKKKTSSVVEDKSIHHIGFSLKERRRVI